jgi:hypothetical protein
MTTQYLVRKIETCKDCDGEGYYYNPEWEEANAHFDALRASGLDNQDGRLWEAWRKHLKEKWPCGEPAEELRCIECEGEGKIDTWVTLQEALYEVYGAPPSGAVHQAWCSCGKSTLCTWNPVMARYEAPDEGWAFQLETNGWTCGQPGHEQAAVSILPNDGSAS